MPLFTSLTDDFQTGVIDTGKWPAQSGVTVSGGQARIASGGYLQSAPIYGIGGSWVYARILVDPAQFAAGGYIQFSVHADATNWAGFRITSDGKISGYANGEEAPHPYYTSTYGRTYLWLRIRHDGYAFWFECTSDGSGAWEAAWNSSSTNYWNLTGSMCARFTAVNAGPAWIDNVNANAGAGMSLLPGSALDGETLTGPAAYNTTGGPDTITDTGTVGRPALNQPNRIWAASTADTGTVTGPALDFIPLRQPDTTADTETLDGPQLASMGIGPASTSDTGKTGAAAVSFTSPTLYDEGEYGWGRYGGDSNRIGVVGVGDSEAVTGSLTGGTIGQAYGSGKYGDGLYNYGAVTAMGPSTVYDGESIGSTGGQTPTAPIGYSAGTYGAGTYNGAAQNTILPAGVYDPDQIYSEDRGDAYGSGPYGKDAFQRRNIGNTLTGYGSGKYGDGTYPGTTSTPGGAATPPPVSLPVIQVVPNPLHILGIGPWSAGKVWHGAPNYGISKGVMPARPVMQLPGIQAKTITLRLDGGSEATATCQFARNSAVVVQEMATDLWWLRKDPRNNKLECLGRLNCSHNDLSRDNEGTVASSLQFQDWRIVLGNRMVLKYLDTKNSESQWPAGTPITEILKFAIPTDTGVDLSNLDNDTAVGKTTLPFTLPPYNTINDTIAALLTVSEKPWEWWVEQGTDFSKPPKLMLTAQRGTDRGVTLFDYGTGPSPIASWSMRRTSDNYANTLYFQGGGAAGTTGGGVVRTDPAAVELYGQRDAQASDNSITGALKNYEAAADKQLAVLADIRPTFTLVLRTGFWRGRHHIDVGDTLRLRLKLGKELVAYSYRVTELQIDIDGAGTETVTVTLGTPLPSPNPRSQYSPIFKLVRTLRNYEPPPGS